MVTFSINASDGITAVSQSLKDDTCANFNINKNIRVIPNFVDITRFTHLAKGHFKKAIAPDGEKIVIHTSNFRKVKRVQDVVKVFNDIQKVIPSKLLMVGDGPERSNAEELCRELGIDNNVRFLGKQDAIEEILSVSDLFLMPSETESFGLAALEAMACKVPVISTNSGGLPEVNVHGKTGFMSNVGDTADMAKNSIHILKDEDTLNTFKEEALTHAKTFDIKNIVPIYEQYYHEILEMSYTLK